MTILNYLINELASSSRAELSSDDKQMLEKASIQEFIYKKLSSKKFRKWSLDQSSEERIKNAIQINVDKQQPIQFTFPFGGYKLWSLPSAPEVDWAEFFTIAYYLKWIAPILTAYKPGVHFNFSSDDVIVEGLDNIPPQDTKAYFDSFSNLLEVFSKHFPPNLTMEITRVGDLYSSAEFEDEFAGHFEKLKKAYENPEPERYKKMLATSALNYQWKGVQDFSDAAEDVKQEKIELGPIIHDAYGKMTRRRAFVRGEEKIVVFTTPIPNAIAIGTTKTSVTKFWTGIGVVEQNGDTFKNRILSPEQLRTFKPQEQVPIELIHLSNFNTVSIYPELDFTHK